MPKKAKKLVAVLVTSLLMTDKKTEEKLEQVTCIWYFVIFKDQTEVLLDSKNKVNTICQAFAQ